MSSKCTNRNMENDYINNIQFASLINVRGNVFNGVENTRQHLNLRIPVHSLRLNDLNIDQYCLSKPR